MGTMGNQRTEDSLEPIDGIAGDGGGGGDKL